MLQSIKDAIIERAAQIVAERILKDYKGDDKTIVSPNDWKPIFPPVTVMYGVQTGPYTALDGITTNKF